MKKINYRGYNGYESKLNNTTFVIFNGSLNTKAEWYVSINKSDYYFSDDELYVTFQNKSKALQYITNLILNR
jgi:hypothetical protein